MKSNLLPSLALFVAFIANLGYSADSTFVLDTIEIRQNQNIGNRYYFKEKKLFFQSDFEGVFIQSSNLNVMKDYLKWKKYYGSEFFFAAGATFLVVYGLSSFVLTKENMNDLWYLPVSGVCLITIGIPTTILRHNYFRKTLNEFNKRKL
jgi:hypothetical protein